MLDTPASYPLHVARLEAPALRLTLLLVRRMAAHGMDDAHATQAAFGFFGLGYRRPLILLRALMLEMARASTRRIYISPCCRLQMTEDEALLIETIAQARPQHMPVHRALSSLLGARTTFPPCQPRWPIMMRWRIWGTPFGSTDQAFSPAVPIAASTRPVRIMIQKITIPGTAATVVSR